MKRRQRRKLRADFYLCGMMTDRYTIREMSDGYVINIAGTQTHLHVYELNGTDFKAKDGDMVFYTTGIEPLAFLVHHWADDQLEAVSLAMRWYLDLEGLPNADISLHDPREKSRCVVRSLHNNRYHIN